MSSPQRISETVTIEGLKEIDGKLQALDDTLAVKIVKASLKAGASVTYDATEETTPHRSGRLAGTLKVKVNPTRKGYSSVTVGFGAKWFTGDEFYAAFVEFGHRVGSRKLGDKRRVVEGEHMLEYAYDETKVPATQVVINTALTLLEIAANKLGST